MRRNRGGAAEAGAETTGAEATGAETTGARGTGTNPAGRAFATQGYLLLPPTPARLAWAAAAWAAAAPRIADPGRRAAGLRCEGTWFAGVDLLPNAADGSVSGVPLPVPPLIGALGLAPPMWHSAQVSVTYPGYPRPKEGESPGAARYRVTRDAAHVDGLLPEGAPPRRFLREPHAFILGIGLTDSAPEAAPLVLWPGSHRALGAAFAVARSAHDGDPATLDLTDVYGQARRAVFDTHPRVPVPLRRGAAILLHRHLLHGIAPWQSAPAPEGRAVAYFRPQDQDLESWFQCDA